MNVTHIVVLNIRLFAVWLAVHALKNIAYSLPLYDGNSFVEKVETTFDSHFGKNTDW